MRSLYPDGNQTHDQTLCQDDDGVAYLFRTYYDTVEYVLPKAVMQPTWESVKNLTEAHILHSVSIGLSMNPAMMIIMIYTCSDGEQKTNPGKLFV